MKKTTKTAVARKLTDAEVRQIVALVQEGEMDRDDIAEQYGITAVYAGQLGRTRRVAAVAA